MSKWTHPSVVLAAFVLGAGIGISLGAIDPALARDVALVAGPLGGLVRRLFELLAVPLVVAGAASAVAALTDSRALVGLLGRAVPYFGATSALAVAVGLGAGAALRPGDGVAIPAARPALDARGLGALLADRFAAIVPESAVRAVAELDLLPLVVLAGLLGVFLARTGAPARPLREVLESLHAVVSRMASFAAALAPIAVLGCALEAGAGHALSELAPIARLVLALALAYTFHGLVVLPVFMALGARRSPAEVIVAMGPAVATAFTTASVPAALPVAVSHARERAGISSEVSGVVFPLGAAIHSDGSALYLAGGALFVAQAHGVELGIGGIALVAVGSLVGSVVAAGIPHGAPVVLAALLSLVDVPLEALGLLLAMDWFQAMGRAVLSVQSHAAVAAILQRVETRRSRISGV